MGFKDQKWSKGAHFLANFVFGEGESRKGRRELGQKKDQVLFGFLSHFLPLRDQATYKKRFEDIQGKKLNPNFIFL